MQIIYKLAKTGADRNFATSFVTPPPPPHTSIEPSEALFAAIKSARAVCILIPGAEAGAYGDFRKAKEKRSIIESFAILYSSRTNEIEHRYVVQVISIVPQFNAESRQRDEMLTLKLMNGLKLSPNGPIQWV